MENGAAIAIFSHLDACGVPFVVIGGHAVNYHGFIRATEDADIVFLRSQDSEENLFKALRQINACWIDREIDPDTGIEKEIPISPEYLKNNRLMMLCTDMGYLDIFDYIPGFPDEPVQTLLDTAAGYRGTKIVSLNWLKRIKRAAGRHKDMNDLENLPPAH